jgi:hypothetical protein
MIREMDENASLFYRAAIVWLNRGRAAAVLR